MQQGHPAAIQVGSPAEAAWIRARLISNPSQAGRFCRWAQVLESYITTVPDIEKTDH